MIHSKTRKLNQSNQIQVAKAVWKWLKQLELLNSYALRG